MKRLIVSLIIFSIINYPALAMQEVKPPSWEEFCPEKYINAEYINKIYYKYMGLKEILYAISIVGIPANVKNYNKENEKLLNNHWVKRRINFENDIKNCNQLSNNDSKVMCYMQVRKNQLDIKNRPIVNVRMHNTNNIYQY